MNIKIVNEREYKEIIRTIFLCNKSTHNILVRVSNFHIAYNNNKNLI
jgi:hypothetical protein